MEIWAICLVIVAIVVVIILANAIKIVREYERVVIFRLGRVLGRPKGPGIFFIIPMIDQMVRVDLRTMVIDVTKQRVITKDNVTVDVDAVVYYRVFDPLKAVVQVQQYVYATTLLSQTTLRDILGQVELDDLLSKREELNKRIQTVLDVGTDAWGMKVTAVTIRDVALPETMLRAIAKQAEAEREKRSRIIMAEGELTASEKMREAAEQYERAPVSLRLRELQTLTEIAREKNLIIVPGGAIGTMAGIAKAVQKTVKE